MANKSRRSKWKMILTVVTFIAMAALTYAVRKQLGDTLQNLRDVNVFAVFLVVPIEFFNNYFHAKVFQGVFRVLGHRFRTRSMIRLSYELNFVNTVFPTGGVSGFSYISFRLKDEQISSAQSTLVQLMHLILVYVSFQILLLIGLVVLAFDGRASNFIMLISGSLVTLLLISTLALAFIVGSKKRIDIFFTFVTKIINRVIQLVRPRRPETINIQKARLSFEELHVNYMHIRRNLSVLKKPLIYALCISLSEIVAIYAVYTAFGYYNVNVGAIILAYAVANFAGIVSVLPGGVGIYEGLMTAVMAAGGVPPAVSLPVTIMYRVFSMGSQLPVGYYFYYRNLHPKNAADELIKTEDQV